MTRILIAESDQDSRKLLQETLSSGGDSVDAATTGEEALAMISNNDYDIALIDLSMKGIDGLEVLYSVKKSSEISCEVIILSPHDTVQTAVEAMRLGAYNYSIKPYKVEALSLVIQKAAERRALLIENMRLKEILRRQIKFPNIISKSPVMLELLETIRTIAPSNVPVHIYGESGVGKELVAMAIHAASHRSNQPFIAVNCAAITESMFESELFGHEKGAFTGAHLMKPGLLELAAYGTLFIDEVAEMPLQTQVKMLRVLETGVFYRVGGLKEIKVDFRLVSASNKDIVKESDKGTFRKDLYWRVGGITLLVPPLREHPEDIPLLIDHYFKHNSPFREKSISPAAFLLLSRYGWPGNVRELFYMVHRAFLLSRTDIIGLSDFPGLIPIETKPAESMRLEDREKEHILRVLSDCENHRRKAADILGISIKTLYRKLKQYGIEDNPPE